MQNSEGRGCCENPPQSEIDLLIAAFNQGRYGEVASLAGTMTKRFPDFAFGWKVLGAALSQLGQSADALKPMTMAVDLSPGDAVARYNRGKILRELGRLEEASASYRQALAIRPDYIEARYNLGNILIDQGQLTEAENCYQQVLELKPEYADARNGLGAVFARQGRHDEAEVCFLEALKIKPDFAIAYFNLGNTYQALGRLTEAAASYRRSVEIKWDYAEAHSNMGAVLTTLGLLGEAVKSCRTAIEMAPDSAIAHNNLGVVLYELRQLNDAESYIRKSLQIHPSYAEAYNNLGLVLRGMGRLAEAEICHKRAVEINPEYVEAHNNLGNIQLDLGRFNEAIACYRRAIEINPKFAVAYNNLGNALQDTGELRNAGDCYRQALDINPEYLDAESNLLFLVNRSGLLSPESCFAEAVRFGKRLRATISSPFTSWICSTSPQRLRVGFISGDLRNHPVGYFLEGLISQLNLSKVELVAYTTHHQVDELTERIKPLFMEWRQIFGLSDEAAAHLIHDDGINVLIDLSGHTRHNRLSIFCWKPAPVQATWLGYFATTGIEEIDYLVADPWTLPESEESYFSEKIWRLPSTRLCFTPPEPAPEVSTLPALTNGYITFGCFNNLSKLGASVIALWSRVLLAVPNSRLFLKNKHLQNDAVRQDIIKHFGSHGVGVNRLILEGSEPRFSYFSAYHRVDIALDPFPYPGGTTSMEGLWMGVPVLTMKGSSFLSRQGLGILMNAGLQEWVAAGADDYLDRAVAYASSLDRLSELRKRLREQVRASPLCDAARFARDFETALYGMWDTLDVRCERTTKRTELKQACCS